MSLTVPEQRLNQAVRKRTRLVQGTRYGLHLPHKAVWIRTKPHRKDNDPSSQRPPDLLVGPIARMEIRRDECCEGVHRPQRKGNFILPFEAGLYILVRNERGHPPAVQHVFQSL